jgi:bacterioferritin
MGIYSTKTVNVSVSHFNFIKIINLHNFYFALMFSFVHNTQKGYGVLKMRGNPEVVDYLNMLIGGELAARDQYLIHSRMYEDWGLSKIFERIDHEMQEEAAHADVLIRRVLFLEGTPNMNRDDIETGEDVLSCLKADLKLEYDVREKLAQGVKLCEEKGDYVTRDMLRQQMSDTEEDHTYWLEKQIRLIELIGLQNYIQSQM